MESYKAIVDLDDFIYYTDGEKALVNAAISVNKLGCVVSLFAFIFLFYGNSLILLWNYFMYL